MKVVAWRYWIPNSLDDFRSFDDKTIVLALSFVVKRDAEQIGGDVRTIKLLIFYVTTEILVSILMLCDNLLLDYDSANT